MQISSVTSACCNVLRKIYSIRDTVDSDLVIELVGVMIFSRLDYCNSFYYGLPAVLHGKLQRIMNCACKLIFRLSPGTPTSKFIKWPHWLPVQKRVLFKNLLFGSSFNSSSSTSSRVILALLCPAMIKLQDASISTTFKFRSLKIISEKCLSAKQFRINGTHCHLN